MTLKFQTKPDSDFGYSMHMLSGNPHNSSLCSNAEKDIPASLIQQVSFH